MRFAGRLRYNDIRENTNNTAISPNWPQSSQVNGDSFVGKLRSKTGLTTLDLPTEAQWEYACRAGTTTPLNSGKDIYSGSHISVSNVNEVARFGWNRSSYETATAVVGSYLPNAWGLYDMHGNVAEYCLDRCITSWHGTNTWRDTIPVVDPTGPSYGDGRILRGGGVNEIGFPEYYLRSASVICWNSTYRDFDTGFRLARTMKLMCELTAPAEAAVVQAGTNVRLEATSSSLDVALTKMEFFANGTKIGEDTIPPFSYEWENVAVGGYALTAVVTDDTGLKAVSAEVTLWVTGSGDWECAAMGGTMTNYTLNGTNFTGHIFTGVGTHKLTVLGGGNVEMLVVGGGGGGGGNGGGGGGAGGVVYVPRRILAGGTHTIVVGGGGSGGAYRGAAGTDSTAFDVIAAGGGGGGSSGYGGDTGGSGGGAGGGSSSRPLGGASSNSSLGVNTGTIYGNRGGNQTANRLSVDTPNSARGGGGAGAAGADEDCNTTPGGAGGVGITNAILGVNYCWGGGGAGAAYRSYRGGNGGLGGGGGGASYDTAGGGNGGGGALNAGGIGGVGAGANGGAGGANTGGGGGGAGGGVGGNGGSGIVIVRYVTAGSPTSTYSVVYVGNGADSGVPPVQQIKTQNVAVVVAGNTGHLARTGFNFVGWNTATNSMGTDCVPGLSYEANASVTLYAKWEPATTILTLAAGSGGAVQPNGAVVVTQSVAVGIAAIAAQGYVFTAWKVMSGAATFANIQAATTTVAITAPATIQAYFAQVAPPPGTVWSWGQNTYGQLGDGTTSNRLLPVQTIGLSNVTAMAATSAGSAFGLSSNGTILAWGYNGYGQLGDGTKTNRLSPTQVRLTDGSPFSNVVAMAAAGNSTYALHSNGTMWACGYNGYGQLGDGTTTNRAYPTQVKMVDGSALSNVVAMAAGENSTYALQSNSTIWAWGYNYYGQLGDGTKTTRLFPTQVRKADGEALSNVVAMVAGGSSVYALRRDGCLYAWGNSSFGQLGDGATSNRLNPAQVTIDGTTALSGVARVCANGNGVLVIRNLTASGGSVSELAGAAAPIGLTATASATNRIELAWTDSATNETGYVVDRSTDSNAWESVTMTSANATNASSTGLTTNTLYYYRVAATNAAGLSAYCHASARTWTVYEQWQRLNFDLAGVNNLSISGATADPDHDGLNNEQEHWAGTIPTNAASCLVLYALTNNPAAPGEYVVRWQSATGRLYTVQAATNLLVVGFTNLATHLPATPPVNVHTDNVSSVGCRFYRVQVE